MVEAIYMDACAKCIADVCDSRDLETIRSRVKHQRRIVPNDYAAELLQGLREKR